MFQKFKKMKVSPSINIQKTDFKDYILETCEKSLIVFVNGNYRSDLSSIEDIPEEETVP